MKNTIFTLLALSLVGSLVSCHDSVEVQTPPKMYSGNAKILYTQIDFTNYLGNPYPIITMDLDGSNSKVIGNGYGLSAAAGRILYMAGNDSSGKFFISNDDGSSAKLLMPAMAGSHQVQWMPRLSPDASTIAYGYVNGQDTVDVNIQDANTGAMRTIDHVAHSETVPGFSPDGKFVVYYDASWANQGSGTLKIAATDGSNIQVLTNIQDPGTDFIGRIAWRPRTQQIAYFDGGETYIINSDGTGKRLLVSGVTPAWSPDGSKLVYAIGNDSVVADLYVTPDLGVSATNITNSNGAYEAYPVWSPDSKTIYALRWSGDYDHTMQSLISIDLATNTNKFVGAPAQFLFVTK